MSYAGSSVLSTAEPFFQALFADLPGLIELRALPSRARHFVPLARLADGLAWAAGHLDEDIYVGIATRRDATGGTLANCLALGALFVDIDFKLTPEGAARAQLARFPLRPSLVVASGGGLHAYWGLREPLILDAQATTQARALLRRLARQFGGDRSVAEPARVLRVPGSFNHKYTPPRWVTLEVVA
jgi:hypothetical protein